MVKFSLLTGGLRHAEVQANERSGTILTQHARVVVQEHHDWRRQASVTDESKSPIVAVCHTEGFPAGRSLTELNCYDEVLVHLRTGCLVVNDKLNVLGPGQGEGGVARDRINLTAGRRLVGGSICKSQRAVDGDLWT